MKRPTIKEISYALSRPLFEPAMKKLGYLLLDIDCFCKDEYYFEHTSGDMIYFCLSDMEYICYTKARTVEIDSSFHGKVKV